MIRRAALSLILSLVAPAAAVGAEVVKLLPSAVLYADEKGTPLRLPQGVACLEGNNVLVADSGNGRILRVQVNGALAVVTGEISVPEVRYPIRVAAEPSGSLVVLDGKSRRLARLQPDGTFGRFIDVPAAPEQRSVSVRGFAMDAQGRLFVLDGVSRRIVVLGPDGSLERAIAVPASLGVLSDVAVDARGGVYALDGVGRRVHVARADETSLTPLSASLAEDLDFPAALDVDASGRIFVADENGGGIVILGRDGSFRGRQSSYGWRPGYLRYPTDLCANGRGLLVVADRENHRIQVFQIVQ